MAREESAFLPRSQPGLEVGAPLIKELLRLCIKSQERDVAAPINGASPLRRIESVNSLEDLVRHVLRVGVRVSISVDEFSRRIGIEQDLEPGHEPVSLFARRGAAQVSRQGAWL